ncbi:MAG: DMT family transporter [Rhizobiales bacterium]|nr:DMT family transporter [Hyphomicrobiales bacterium]
MNSSIGQARVDDASARLMGIGFMCAAWLTFSGIDASAKFLASFLPVAQIVLLRYGGGLAYSLLLVALKGIPDAFRTARPVLQLLRGSVLVVATAVNFFALRFLQLDQTAAIMFAIPLIVCVLSVPILGERVGWRRWAAVVVGFIGVLIIIRPGFDSFHWAMLLVVVQAIMAAIYMILTRKVSAHDRVETSLFYTGLVGTVLVLPFGVAQWQPLSEATLLPALVIGFCGGLGHHLVIIAHRLAPAPVIAPFGYTHIIWMTLLGYLLFNQLPDAFTIVGASIVVSCGLFLLYREHRLKAATDPHSSVPKV